MSYQHEHIPFVEPIDGYNQVAGIYHNYHKKLNEWDSGAIMKYLPRSLHGAHILDLGGGDGRRAIGLQGANVKYDSWTIVDNAQAMLDHAPIRTERICADIREPLPLTSHTYDLIIITFVLLHLDSISSVFAEARRCITPGGRMLIVHHYERRPFVYQVESGNLKIKTRHRRYEELETELQATGWEVDVFPVDTATKILCCFPA